MNDKRTIFSWTKQVSWKFFDPLRTKKDKNIKQIGLSVDWMNTFQRHKQQIISNSNTNIWHKFSHCFPIELFLDIEFEVICDKYQSWLTIEMIYILLLNAFTSNFCPWQQLKRTSNISWFTIIIPFQNNGWTKTEKTLSM